MKHQTVLGFDFGLKYIGVAVGQTVTGTANPLASLRAQAGQPQWEKVAALITHWRPDALIVGVPLAVDGSDHAITLAARRFAQDLQQRHNIPLLMVDERFTTIEARQCLFEQGGYRALNKSSIDGWSAKIITENGLKQWAG